MVEVISAGRGEGKTAKLIKMAKANAAAIVLVHSDAVCEDLRRRNPDIARRIFSVRSFNAGQHRGIATAGSSYLIDNIELCISELTGANVAAITVTK